MLQLSRNGLRLQSLTSLDESQGSSNVKVSIQNDGTYTNYSTQLHYGYYVHGFSYTKGIARYENGVFILPREAFEQYGLLNLSVLLVSSDEELMTNQVQFIVQAAPRGDMIIDDIPSAQQQVLQLVQTTLDQYANTINLNKNEIAVLKTRMDSFTSLQQGSTTGDAELIDGRVGYDGKTYENIGAAIRGQVSQLSDEINNIENKFKNQNLINIEKCLINCIPKTVGYNNDITNDENVQKIDNYVTSNVIECKPNQTYIHYSTKHGNNVFYANKNKEVISSIEVSANTPFTIPKEVYYFRIAFTVNGEEFNNDKWKEIVKLAKGNSLEDLVQYGVNELKNKPNETIIIPRGKNYSEGEAILLLNFDGWNQHTFDIISPYLKEKNIPFTLFFTGYDKAEGINPNDLRNYFQEMGNNFEIGMYTGHPSSTMESNTNFKEQMKQIKSSFDGIVNYGLPIPSVCSYAGGVKTELTEYLCQNVFKQKIGRTTENSKIINPITTTFSIPCSGYGDDGVYPISVVDSIVSNKQHRAVMTHNILSDEITDTSYNMRESYLKAWIDKIASKVKSGNLKCMTFSQYYIYTILPHNFEIGKHALVWENDNKQHEYVFTEKGWLEITR